VVSERPVRKSKYTSISRLEALLNAGNPGKGVLPKATGGGITIIPLEKALLEMPERLEKIFSREEKPKDQFEAFVNANFSSGFVAVIGKNAGKENIEINAAFSGNVCVKNIFIVERGCRAIVAEKISGNGNALVNETVFIEDGAEMVFLKINTHEGGMVEGQQCILQNNAKLENFSSWFGGKLSRGKTTTIFDGNGAEGKDLFVLLGKGSANFDLNYISVHRGTNSSSHAVFRAVLKDESRNVFDGMIRILPSGGKANALLECHSMILGEKASSNQIPGLEIETDDVKATHSATVARIDDEKLFYLESRGIAKKEAEKMVVKGFLESVVFMLNEKARAAIEAQIEKSL